MPKREKKLKHMNFLTVYSLQSKNLRPLGRKWSGT
jgi:hypothetical protein